jgi:predicted PurR-regulated permease PerM
VDTNGKMPKWVPRAIVLFWLGFLATFLVRNTVQKLSSLALLLLVATFITLALEPGVNRLSSRGMKRGSATGLMLVSLVVATLGFVAAMGTIVGQQVADLLANSERYVNDIVKIINDVGNTRIDPAEVNATISDPNGPVQKFILAQRDNAFKVSVQAVGALFQGFSVLLFAFYFIADGPRLRRVICSRLKPERQRVVLDAWELAITKTGGFLYSRALLAVLSALFHWILFQSVGAPAPIAMALWVGLISQFIPVIGTYLAGVLPVLLTFIESPTKALIILGFIFFYQQLENYLFSPRITARTLELHPALAFGGALAGAAVLGPIGALLALPGVAMGQALISAWGVRHDVIDDPLTHVAPTKVREKKSKKLKNYQES